MREGAAIRPRPPCQADHRRRPTPSTRRAGNAGRQARGGGTEVAPDGYIATTSFHLGLLCLGALGPAACTIDVGRLPMASTRGMPDALVRRPELTRGAGGRSCVWVVGVVPLGAPSLGDAVARALDRAHADALWDAEVRYHLAYVPPFGRACYAVSGHVP